MALSDFLINTDSPMDKISGFETGSFSLGSFGTVSPSVPHNLGYKPLFFVRWSTSSTFDTSFDELGVTFNFVFLFTQADSDNMYFFASNLTATAYTIYYRIIYFMPTNLLLDAPNTQFGLDNFNINTDFNYSKVLIENVTGSGNQAIDHNLGYYPQCEVWYERASDGRMIHLVENSANSSSLPKAQLTTSQLILTQGSSVAVSAWHYKIYADEI